MELDDNAGTLARLADAGVLALGPQRELRSASALALKLLGSATLDELRGRWPDLLPKLPDAPNAGAPSRSAFDVDFTGTPRRLRAEAHATRGGCLVLVKDRSEAGVLDMHLVESSRIRALDFLASIIVHDLSAPLHNLQLTLSLLQAAVTETAGVDAAELQRRGQRYAEVLQQELLKLRGLIRNLPSYLAAHRAGTQEDIDIRAMVEEAARLIRQESTARRIRPTLSLPPAPLMIRGEVQSLRLAVLNLLIALMTATEAGGSLRIDLGQEGERVRMSVRAGNCKLSDEVLNDLYAVALSAANLPVELVAARLIIESHHGEIAAARESETEVRFDVSLPLRAQA